jgi:hypothetical protein
MIVDGSHDLDSSVDVTRNSKCRIKIGIAEVGSSVKTCGSFLKVGIIAG